jgi:MarR family 2-MHQ and catechol resistance regulon transcriptional repressor
MHASGGREGAVRALIRFSVLLRRYNEVFLGRFGVSGAQWGVLRTLDRAEREGVRGLRLGELGERMLVRPPSMTGVVDRLERIGYIQKHPSADDRRAKEVRLTPSGRRVLRSLLSRQDQRVDDIIGALSDTETRTLVRIIEGLSERLAARQGSQRTRRGQTL